MNQHMEDIFAVLNGVCGCSGLDSAKFQERESMPVELRSTHSLLDSVAVHDQFYRKGSEFYECPSTPRASTPLHSPPRLERKLKLNTSFFRDAVTPTKLELQNAKSLLHDDASVSTASTAESSSLEPQNSSVMNEGNLYWLETKDSSFDEDEEDELREIPCEPHEWSPEETALFSGLRVRSFQSLP